MIRPLSVSFVFILGIMCWAMLLAGCEELKQLAPPEMKKYVGPAARIGEGVYNRPKFTEADEERMAQDNAKTFEEKNKLMDDPLLDTYLGDIVQRLVANAHPRPFTYSIRVVKDTSINAFTFGGGILYVNAGLLARMENEAQLAMVIGHEIAHVTESHVTKGIEERYGMALLGQVAGEAAATSGKVPLSPQTFQLTYDYSMKAAVSGHGQSSESEADVVGLDYMVMAGYDPREAPRTFEQLLKEYGDQGVVQNFFYGNHPRNETRIKTLNGLVQTKYTKDMETRKLVVNTAEFKQRTRELVVMVGQLDYGRKRFKTATAMFEKALQANGSDPVSHYYLGKIALETGSTDQAIAHLTSALKGDVKPAEAYRELGLAYYKKKDSAKAIDAFEQYLQAAPRANDADRIKKSIEDLKRS